MVSGIRWAQGSLLFIVVVSIVLLAIVITVNVFVARKCGFNKADEITIVFCGSKKSTGKRHPDGPTFCSRPQ